MEELTIREIAQKIKKAGGRLYLVGGAVRDIMLGIEPKDTDYCVTGLTSYEFANLFPEAFVQGVDFPVYRMYGSEFALARLERKTGNKHTDFEITANKNVTIEEDLRRRDITINSMAIDVLTQKLIDPTGGAKDMKNKTIRATSEAYTEDSLRVYRTARFAAAYNFTIDEDTINMMTAINNQLEYISVERVYVELYKALCTRNPSIFFRVLKETDSLPVHFREIYDLIGVEQPIKFHPEGDVFNHTMEVIDRAAKITREPRIIFAALMHDVGKANTPRSEWPHHYTHDKDGVELIKKMCKRLRLPISWEKSAIDASREHMNAGRYDEMKTSTKVDFLARISKTYLGLEGLELIVNVDKNRAFPILFAEIGRKMLEEVKAKKMTEDDYVKIKEMLRQERIKWLKEKEMESGKYDDRV